MRASLRRADRSTIKFAIIALTSVALFLSCESRPFISKQAGTPGEIKDEVRLANRAAVSFSAADEDYFADMDGDGKLSPEEVKGCNNPPPPSSQVGSHTLLNLRSAYRFWKQQAAVGYFREAQVAVPAFNALNDKHKEHPVGGTIGKRGLG